MLPPKLAQIMINLAGYTKFNKTASETIYDPFCGIGTIPTEGILLNYEVIGSDILQEVLDKTQQNIDWLIKKYNLKPVQPILFKKDAQHLDKNDFPKKIDLVITESYLGPPLKKIPTADNIYNNFHIIRTLILNFFKSLREVITAGTSVIITIPFYRANHKFHFIENIEQDIAKIGYKPVSPIPQDLANKFTVIPTNLKHLLYDRPDQIVGREILKFLKI
jgi:tRNA G10  N-methylase Trm11